MSKYSHIDFKPPQGVRDAYRRGLELHEEGKTGSGLEPSTVSMARKLAAGENVSPEWARKGNRFWGRNERFLKEDKDSPAYASAMLWGSSAGKSWFAKLVKQMDAADEKEKSINKESAANVMKEESDGWHVYSESGKHMGGPYSKEKAQERLRQIEYFKGNSMRLNRVDKLQVNQEVSKRRVRGKDMVVVHGAVHMIGDSVMNGIFYPMEEMTDLCNRLEGKRVTMPASHPTDDGGNFMSANDPLALMSNFVGAYAENFSIKGDKLISDVLIDPELAELSDSGKEIMKRIKSGDDLDMSTGFYFTPQMADGIAPDGEEYEKVAANLEMDHSAFLPYEDGAKMSNEGVGLHANCLDQNGQECDMSTFEVNASAAGKNFPLAETGTKWDADAAVKRIREFSNSKDAPSTNYRKYFMYFDREDSENFTAYKLPFVDIIDGRPHVVPKAIGAIEGALSGARGETVDIPEEDKKSVKSLLDHYKAKQESASNSNESAFSKALKALKDAFGITDGYNSVSGVEAAINKSDEVQRMDMKEVRNMVSKYGNMDKEKVDNMSDQEVKNVMDRMFKIAGENMKGKNEDEKKPSREDMKEEQDKMAKGNSAEAPAWASALMSKVEALETAVNSQQDTQKQPLIEMAVNMGISEATAKAMPVEDLKVMVGNSGEVNFNAGYTGFAANSKVEDYDAPDAL